MSEESFRAGYVALSGRPNVGKSTLLNRFLGTRLAITAPKPQTTRHQILGVHTTAQGQIVFLDTPGIHVAQPRAINRYLNRVASAPLEDVDIILWLVEPRRFTEDDERVGSTLAPHRDKLWLVINKIDRAPDKQELLPRLAELNERFSPAQSFLISARKGDGCDDLERALIEAMPRSERLYGEDELTDRSERFLAAEFIREQLVRLLHAELPYALTVEVEGFRRDESVLRIDAVVWVERQGQKAIVIGAGGETLKEIGTRARKTLEGFFAQKVFLQLWVKVRRGWSDDEAALAQFGMRE